MTDYQNVKIANEIIIVEKPAAYQSWVTWRKVKGQGMHQGYVVDAGNKKSLETAMKWAECREYDESLRPTKAPYNWDKYYESVKIIPGVEHKYQNGQFEITLCDSADNSSQSGKLSFWNCIITCPDGKEFLVGINADILLELLLKNTFIDGKCQSKVWLGRIKGTQVGAFTENMELYEQAQKDEASRQAASKADSKYVPGDILKTLTEKDLYLGSVYQYYSFESSGYYRDNYIVVYKKPRLVHIYRGYYIGWNSDKEELSSYYRVKNTKVKRVVEGHVNNFDPALEFIKKYNEKSLKEDKAKDEKYPGSRYTWDAVKVAEQYGDSPTSDRDEIIKYLEDEYQKYCKKWGYSIHSEYKIIDEDEWEKIKY